MWTWYSCSLSRFKLCGKLPSPAVFREEYSLRGGFHGDNNVATCRVYQHVDVLYPVLPEASPTALDARPQDAVFPRGLSYVMNFYVRRMGFTLGVIDLTSVGIT